MNYCIVQKCFLLSLPHSSSEGDIKHFTAHSAHRVGGIWRYEKPRSLFFALTTSKQVNAALNMMYTTHNVRRCQVSAFILFLITSLELSIIGHNYDLWHKAASFIYTNKGCEGIGINRSVLVTVCEDSLLLYQLHCRFCMLIRFTFLPSLSTR